MCQYQILRCCRTILTFRNTIRRNGKLFKITFHAAFVRKVCLCPLSHISKMIENKKRNERWHWLTYRVFDYTRLDVLVSFSRQFQKFAVTNSFGTVERRTYKSMDGVLYTIIFADLGRTFRNYCIEFVNSLF